MVEKLSSFPEVVHSLEPHEVGYHSSSNSVRPTIFEFTDVESYDKAHSESRKRETYHIDQFTG